MPRPPASPSGAPCPTRPASPRWPTGPRGWLRLAALPRAARRVALVLSDYPARGGRAGFAVGLDTPASAGAIAADLAAAPATRRARCRRPGR
ncbi:cobaltochelatase subunit CobN [Methylobacterium oryzae CBMB20]